MHDLCGISRTGFTVHICLLASPACFARISLVSYYVNGFLAYIQQKSRVFFAVGIYLQRQEWRIYEVVGQKDLTGRISGQQKRANKKKLFHIQC